MNDAKTIGSNALVLDTAEENVTVMNAEESKLGNEVSLIEQRAEAVVVASGADFEDAGLFLKQIKQAQKQVKDYWEPLRVSAKKSYDEVLTHRKEMIEPLEKAEKIVKTKVNEYSAEQERKRREQEEAMRRLAQAEIDRHLNEAAEAEANGDAVGAEYAIMASEGTRFDSAEDASVFFARELDHVKAQSYDVEYPELTALHLFPQSSEADPGAETITYYTYDKTGLAKIIDNYSTDLPRADVTGKPSFAKIKSIGDSYGYSAQEMRASRLAGKSLDARKGESARYQIDALTNKIAWCGDEESGLMGVLSDGQNIPLYTIGANAGGKTKWAEKSADEILADVNGMAKQVAKITKNVERPDTLCVPADVFMDISTRRIPDTSTTVLAFIQEHAPYIKNVVSTAELDADSPETNPYATSGNPQGVAFLFKNDPRKLTLENPMPFYQYPLQVEKLETIILCEARTAGVIVYYPLSALIAVGVS